jgi:hypothetical protein
VTEKLIAAALVPAWLACAGGAVTVWAAHGLVALARRSLVVLPRSPAA